VFDSILDKTPLSHRTNRKIGGAAPFRVPCCPGEGRNARTPGISPAQLDAYLASHLIDPKLLRADDFRAFMDDQQAKLLALIEKAMGKAAYRFGAADEADTEERNDETAEAEMTMATG